MPLCGEDEVVNVYWGFGFVSEKEVEVFEGLRQDKAVHPVLFLQGPDVLDGCIATSHSGVLLKAAQDLFAHIEIVRVSCGTVEEVS